MLSFLHTYTILTPIPYTRSMTHFDPKTVCAAVVTCGGLCPGLNNVIRELVHGLEYLYGVEKILGIK